MKRLFLAAIMAGGLHAFLLSSGAGWFSKGVPLRQVQKAVILSLAYLPSPVKTRATVQTISQKPIMKPMAVPRKLVPKRRKVKKVHLKPKPRPKPVSKPKLVQSKLKRAKPVHSPPLQEPTKVMAETPPLEYERAQEKASMPLEQDDEQEPVTAAIVEDALADLPYLGHEAAPQETADIGALHEKTPVVQVARPLYRKNPRPRYPRLARRRGYQGVVILEVLVRRDGTPGKVQVFQSSGHRILDRAAIKAVEKWSFAPGSENGTPIDMWVKIPVRFQLDEG
ncbi:MAG: energy transducer TonB [Deltaproteobacteria bacterium]|nr:energy transducer TonB [Deltaproteobacteria bacterium]